MLDTWDVAGLVFCLTVLAVFGVAWLIKRVDRTNPFAHSRRVDSMRDQRRGEIWR